ncbi:MAG: metal-dependent hydrolase [Burkholderiales bacterium]|nr:metal-dependent hydrolase [Burkholderiales bacterium]
MLHGRAALPAASATGRMTQSRPVAVRCGAERNEPGHPGAAGAHPQLALLWGWHAVEETEHKAVAFDVYRRCGGGYLRRLAAGLYASFFLALDLLVQVLGLLRDDRQRASPRQVLRSAWNVYFGPDRVAAALWRGFMHFARPGFHPWQVDNRADVESWLHAHAQAFAASAPTLQPAPSASS